MVTLEEFLEGGAGADNANQAVISTILKLAKASAQLSAIIADGDNNSGLGDEGQSNVQGERQKHLDVLSNQLFVSAAAASPVRFLLSEEEEEPLALVPDGVLSLAVDPLDGSSNIDINAPIGSIFALYPALPGAAADQFLRPGRDLLAAGYVIYGARTDLVLSLGKDVFRFALSGDRSHWNLSGQCTIPVSSNELAINASNHRHWPGNVRAFVNACLQGRRSKFGADYNMRWLAALVGETHRILSRGGLFIYPEDSRSGYETGRLRYCYECAPISFLIENAGGMATDGRRQILDITPDSLHARTPFCFGSVRQMELLHASRGEPAEDSPLFSDRGFFRARA